MSHMGVSLAAVSVLSASSSRLGLAAASFLAAASAWIFRSSAVEARKTCDESSWPECDVSEESSDVRISTGGAFVVAIFGSVLP